MTIDALKQYRALVVEIKSLTERAEALSSEVDKTECELLRDRLKKSVINLEARRRHINDWLETSPTQDRPIMIMYYCLGLSWSETAKLNNRTESLVYHANRRMVANL